MGWGEALVGASTSHIVPYLPSCGNYCGASGYGGATTRLQLGPSSQWQINYVGKNPPTRGSTRDKTLLEILSWSGRPARGGTPSRRSPRHEPLTVRESPWQGSACQRSIGCYPRGSHSEGRANVLFGATRQARRTPLTTRMGPKAPSRGGEIPLPLW